MNITLWVLQGLLALAFVMAGGMKTFNSLNNLKKMMDWVNVTPAPLVRLIGLAELLGGIGLILPEATGILPWLTVAAAIGLAIIMLGAVIFHIVRKEFNQIAPSLVLLLIAVFIIIGRLVLVPIA